MKFLLIFILSIQFSFAEDQFEVDASALVHDLKAGLLKKLDEKIKERGLVETVSYCQLNVKDIAKENAGKRIEKFSFGRTSHKVRNPANAPVPFMEKYLARMILKKKGSTQADKFIHVENGKRVYLESLYVAPVCLNCHGKKIAPEVQSKISELYPKDKAVGFSLGDFRGFIWVKEK